MSDINLQWLVDNFSNKKSVIFDVGCADVNGDSTVFKKLIPDSEVYAFECSQTWKEHNEYHAKNNGIHYFHVAMSDNTDGVTFYPSDKNNEQDWPWSGSTCKPGKYLDSVGLKFAEPYTVPSVTLNQFCREHEVFPDFIHIDAQGAEYIIFKDMTVRPLAIWAEISEFHLYDTGVTYDMFNEMMLRYGYEQKYLDSHDTLYVLDVANLSDYPTIK